MLVGPEILESCHEILHALINKPIDFKLSSSVQVSKTYEMIFTEHSTIVILAIENLQKLIPGPSCSKHRFVSLTSLLRGQLVKCFTTSSSNTLKFFVEKMREAFAMQKLLTFFSTKNIGIFETLVFESLTNDIVSFEQPGPGKYESNRNARAESALEEDSNRA